MPINPTKLPVTNSSNNYNRLDAVRLKIDPSKTEVEKYGNTTSTSYFDKNGEEILVFQEHRYTPNAYCYNGVDEDGKSCLVELYDKDKDGNIDIMHTYYNKDGTAPKNLRVNSQRYERVVSSTKDNGKFDYVGRDNLPWHAKPQIQDDDKKGIFDKCLDWCKKVVSSFAF